MFKHRQRNFSLAVIVIVLLMALLITMSIAAIDAGDLDPAFSGDGYTTFNFGEVGDYAYDVVYQSDGKFVAVGESFNGATKDFALIRFNADGSPDTSFDGDGFVRTDFGGDDAAARAALQADGKIVVVGSTTAGPVGSGQNIAVARYNVNGSLDTTFDTDGMVITSINNGDDTGADVMIDGSGKIVVVGGYVPNLTFPNSTGAVVTRYTSTGALDATFNGGIFTDSGFGRLTGGVIDGAGKIMAIGRGYQTLRLTTGGTLDTTYDGDGKAQTNPTLFNDFGTDVVIYPGGKYILFGWSGSTADSDLSISRINSNGTFDNTFSGDGVVSVIQSGIDFVAYGGTVDPSGRVVAFGSYFNESTNDHSGMVVRINADGTLDTSFSGDGFALFGLGQNEDRFRAGVLLPNDRILAVGHGMTDTINHDFMAAQFHGVAIIPTSTNTPEAPPSVDLLDNGGFETPGTTAALAQNWNLQRKSADKRKCNTDLVLVSFEGLCAFVFKGKPYEGAKLSQSPSTLFLSSGAGDTLDLSFQFMTGGVRQRMKIKVVTTYTNSVIERAKATLLDISQGVYKPYVVPTITLSGTVQKIKVQFINREPRGKLMIDDVRLIFTDNTP